MAAAFFLNRKASIVSMTKLGTILKRSPKQDIGVTFRDIVLS